ncbi:MAG: hypothetical protein ACREJO_03475 [Phycisphaerales bacterium]
MQDKHGNTIMDEREHLRQEVAGRGDQPVVNPFVPSGSAAATSLDELVAEAQRVDAKLRTQVAPQLELCKALAAAGQLLADLAPVLTGVGWAWRADSHGRAWMERGHRRVCLCLVPKRSGEPEHWSVFTHLPGVVVEDVGPSSVLRHLVLMAVGRWNTLEMAGRAGSHARPAGGSVDVAA